MEAEKRQLLLFMMTKLQENGGRMNASALTIAILERFNTKDYKKFGAPKFKNLMEMEPFCIHFVWESTLILKLKTRSPPSIQSGSTQGPPIAPQAIQAPGNNVRDTIVETPSIPTLSLKLQKLLSAAVQTTPGLSLTELIKQNQKLKPIYFIARHPGHSPLDIVRQYPQLVTVNVEGHKKLLYPPSFANNATTAQLPPSRHPAPQQLARPKITKVSSSATTFLVDDIASSEKAYLELQQRRRLAVDCEGVNLGKDGRLTVVQVATELSEVYIVDVIGLLGVQNGSEALAKLMALVFCDKDRVVVMHDCRRDAEALYHQYQIHIQNVMDTQVLYGTLQSIQGALGKTKRSFDLYRIGLNKLLSISNLSENSQKERIVAEMEEDVTFWERRPLTDEMISYAASDVTELLSLESWLQSTISETVERSIRALSNANMQWFIGSSNHSNNSLLSLDLKHKLTISRPDHVASYAPVGEDDFSENLGVAAAKPMDDEDLSLLFAVLPESLRHLIVFAITKVTPALEEILLSCYRLPVLRYEDSTEMDLESITISPEDVREAVHYLCGGLSQDKVFTSDNRAGLPGTLHRISATRDRFGDIVALTYRVGRHVPGASEMIRDIVARVGPTHSLLLLGPPGSGKTTGLRDIIRFLANELRKRVVVVDTSNEIAGSHSKPHACIGRAHRMQVDHRRHQHEILIEAVQNQNPQVIVIDEIGTVAEVASARTVAQRGIGMVATAHGTSVQNVLKNPTLRPLLGGVQAVILGDKESLRRGTSNPKKLPVHKTQLERAGEPTFGIVVEVIQRNRWRIYANVSNTIDEMLVGNDPIIEERWMDDTGNIFSKFVRLETLASAKSPEPVITDHNRNNCTQRDGNGIHSIDNSNSSAKGRASGKPSGRGPRQVRAGARLTGRRGAANGSKSNLDSTYY
ncbi:hypothetical protein SmJEL517_g03023 [Synchytrium microbalum]|uniref:AAA+ ATPase domain-containing protein n=1 Tax=Synchytrium microbalum TaxID=1806994 RepID=A0A507C5F8_9FUNG|nr:uncharacterized protein SmJEL517_g03023 [Synchytrium microbalum]TPX34359.1 hypothetical protein SmJEL517_g03023 [Synchytrium microbalum]